MIALVAYTQKSAPRCRMATVCWRLSQWRNNVRCCSAGKSDLISSNEAALLKSTFVRHSKMSLLSGDTTPLMHRGVEPSRKAKSKKHSGQTQLHMSGRGWFQSPYGSWTHVPGQYPPTAPTPFTPPATCVSSLSQAQFLQGGFLMESGERKAKSSFTWFFKKYVLNSWPAQVLCLALIQTLLR